MRTVIARAPTRIDLGGGWTDVPPFPEEEGGRVCNVAIDRYASVTLQPGPTDEAAVRSAADSPLVLAALRRLRLTGIRSSLRSDFPTGAGLGGSSAVCIATLAALKHWQGLPIHDRAPLIADSRAIETDDLGIAGGWQDHFAAAYGGALDLTFAATNVARPIPLTDATQRDFEAQCLVTYTGQSRISGDTILAVLDAYRRRDPAVLDSLRRMRDLAGEMCNALSRGDLDALGDLLDAHWRHQRRLHPAIPTERIDLIIETARREGARGAKALGASGGGCVAIMAPPHAVERVRNAIEPLGRLLPFAVDTTGVTVMETSE